MRVARRLRVRGRVQGVGFRYFVAEAARASGVHGWVRNCPDGSVEALAVGDLGAVDRLEDAVRRGPALARVDTVDVSAEVSADSMDGFRITT